MSACLKPVRTIASGAVTDEDAMAGSAGEMAIASEAKEIAVVTAGASGIVRTTVGSIAGPMAEATVITADPGTTTAGLATTIVMATAVMATAEAVGKLEATTTDWTGAGKTLGRADILTRTTPNISEMATQPIAPGSHKAIGKGIVSMVAATVVIEA
ncbi:MAG: hypothetical protein ACREDR_04795 [Blastocatellia bacterium]